MRIGLVTNKFKDTDYSFTKSVIEYLNKKNTTPIIHFNHEFKDCDYIVSEGQNFFDEIDYLISMGGDGTLLTVSYCCAKRDIPILVVNLGTLGYLANVERDEVFDAIDKLIEMDFDIDERSMLEASYSAQSETIKQLALNDLVVTKGLMSKVVHLDVNISGVDLGIIRGDGIIISTPTGSTAYNISAGGPILEPTSNTVVITPICSQTPSFPIVISADDEVTIKVTYRSASDVALASDGELVKYIKNGDQIKIKKAQETVKLIKTFDKSYFEMFQKKYFHDYK